MTLKQIEQKLHCVKNKIGLVGGTIEVKEYDETEKNVSACISPQGWDTKITVRKGFQPVQDKRQKAYARAKKIQDGLETMLVDLASHEFAHWELAFSSGKGCPFSVYWHDKILEAVKQELPKTKQGQASYVTNAFEDMVINPRGHEFNGDFVGQVLFWDWEGFSCREQGREHYTLFYEAFVKLNMHLFGDNKDRALLKRHYSNEEQVDAGVQNVVRDLSLQEHIQDTTPLFNKPQWIQMATTFTRHLQDLLEESPVERLSAFEPEDKPSSEDQEPAGNGIEQQMPTRQGKEEIAHQRYLGNEGPSPNITNYDQLNLLYKRLAKAIPVSVEAMARKRSLEVAPLNYRPFDEETDDPRRIKASRLFLTDNGLGFAHPNTPLTVVERSKIQRRSFPDFKMIVLDTSGTMAQAPDGSSNTGKTSMIPWGDNSRYHYALLGFYGVENFLQQQGIAQYIDHGISLFSNTTRYKEGDFSQIDEVRKHALNPDWGSTNIDASVLSQALRGRESFVLSISDGAVHNWSTEKEKFYELIRNNYFAHIQLGSRTRFTEDLESWKIPVFYVNSGQDLSKLMVDITVDTYHKFTRGENGG